MLPLQKVNNVLFLNHRDSFNRFGLHLHTGYLRKVHRSLKVQVPGNILHYLSIPKLPRKNSHQSYLSIEFTKKISYYVLIFMSNFYK